MFVSPAFAPLKAMQGRIGMIAVFNPVAHATDAVRGSVFGTATASDAAVALMSAGIPWPLVVLLPRQGARAT
jgi:ABC-2 type transport system permease protein